MNNVPFEVTQAIQDAVTPLAKDVGILNGIVLDPTLGLVRSYDRTSFTVGIIAAAMIVLAVVALINLVLAVIILTKLGL